MVQKTPQADINEIASALAIFAKAPFPEQMTIIITDILGATNERQMEVATATIEKLGDNAVGIDNFLKIIEQAA